MWTLAYPRDSASRNFGSQDGFTFCGQRKFEIATQPASLYDRFVKLREADLIIEYQSLDERDIGVHELEMKVLLLDYPEVEIV